MDGPRGRAAERGARRKALRGAMARWHPDKWRQFAPRFAKFGSEEARVLAGVAETARVINCAKARLDDEDAREDRGGEDAAA